jgi:hypothetical protein
MTNAALPATLVEPSIVTWRRESPMLAAIVHWQVLHEVQPLLLAKEPLRKQPQWRLQKRYVAHSSPRKAHRQPTMHSQRKVTRGKLWTTVVQKEISANCAWILAMLKAENMPPKHNLRDRFPSEM